LHLAVVNPRVEHKSTTVSLTPQSFKLNKMGSEEFSSLRLRRIATKLEGAVSSTNFTRQAEPDEPVTPCGRLFCQPNMNCYIMCTLGFKNPINLPDFKRALQETLVKHKRFHSVMVSFPYSKTKIQKRRSLIVVRRHGILHLPSCSLHGLCCLH
jgi:hypothetical protein